MEEAMNGILLSDELFYEEILEQVNIERDFMLSCFENNIILEAEAPSSENKGGWIRKILDTIKSIFNKFLENVTNLFKNDEKWISQNIPKLKDLNFDGLKVTVLPYWNLDTKTITGVLADLQREITNMKYGDARLKNLQDRESVEQFGAFKKYTPKNGTFTDGIKAFFKTGENNEPKPVTLEGDGLKIVCVNQMSRYVNEFNSTLLPSLKSSYNNYTRLLSNVEKELSRSNNVKESFCIIENAFYADTELAFCNNFDKLYEATVSNEKNKNGKSIIDLDSNEHENVTNKSTNKNNTENKSTNNQKDDPPLNKVEDTSKDNNTQNNNENKSTNSNGNIEYYTYLKHVIQLNQIAIAAAITACEERYRSYMSILKGVVSARGGK